MWSLITVTYNSANRLREYWADIELSDQYEWIVVDNGSTDDSISVAVGLGARVIETGENLGFSRANNIGLRAARGDLILFANPDLRVRTSDLPDLAQIIDRRGGLVSPRLTSPDGNYQYNGRGWPFLPWKVRNRLSASGAPTDYLRPATEEEYANVAWLTGASVAARRVDFELVDGWDESYFLYNEDVAIGLMARRCGLAVGIATQISWVHGWAREPAKWRLKPMLRELSSTFEFYRREPLFLTWPAQPWRSTMDRYLNSRYGVGLELH